MLAAEFQAVELGVADARPQEFFRRGGFFAHLSCVIENDWLGMVVGF
jgi:hypothetical protein